MKQKRKVKSLLSSKFAGSNKPSILLFTVSGILCMFAIIFISSSKLLFAAPLQYTGVNDNNQVVYEVNLIDPIDYATDVHSMYVTGGSVYVTPKPLIVNRTIGNTDTQNPNNWDSASNQVLGSVYGNILGGELNKISSDNVTIIAGEGNEVNVGNENATILGGEGNTLATNGGEEGVMVGGKGNEINSNGLVVGGEGNTVNTSSSRILGGEGNTVNANNAIVGGKNVEGNAENSFVYSSDGSYYEANAGGTFYLGVENGLGINTDGNTKGLSVEGSLGEGEINVNDPAQKCNTNNIGMQGMYQGCLVGCTSKSAAVGKWEMMDQGEECRKKEEGREQSNENIMQSPKLQEEKLLEDLPAGKCSEGTVNTWQSVICGTPASYKGMIFETTLVDQGKCPSNTDKLINNQCAYQCQPGSNLTGDTTNHFSLKNLHGEGDRRKITGCFKNCTLDGQEVKHNAKIIGYNVSSVKCSNDSYSFPLDTRFPRKGNGSYETCGNDNEYIHKKTLICIDGTLYLEEDTSKVARDVDYAGYVYKSCTLGGYDCKTDASNYFIPESTLKTSTWEGRILNGASTWGDDRKEVKGTKGTYELCISYNAPTAVNGETCTKKSFNYKLKKCNKGYYWKSDSEGCQLCEAGYYCPGEDGKSPRYEVSNGYYAIAGQDHQTQCPDGYRDGTVHANKVSEASCLRNMPAGYYMASGKSTSNTECANGYYKTAHTVTYGQTSSCTICPAGYRNGTSVDNKKAENVCLKNVAAGYYVPSAHAAETVCANGYYRTAHTVTYGATSSCTICPAGYRDGTVLANKTAENVCLKNVSCGKYVPTAKGAETNCPAGYYRTDAHSVTYGATSSCTKASAGSYVGSAGKCAQTACGGGKWSNAGASACSNINAGCYGTSATSACPAACGAGKWSAAGSASCSNIKAGCYGTSGGSDCPAACGAGKWSAAGSASCSNINAGCYGTSASTACPAACGAGKWSAAGSASCSNINAGCYGTSAGSACPAACGAGKWSAAGSASCSNINAGCYGTSAGSACPAACSGRTKYSGAGASGCSTVSAGYYTTGCDGSGNKCTGQAQCSCGNYCSNGVSYACGAGKYSSAGATSCSTASVGYYANSSCQQYACTNKKGGSYYTSNSSSNSCSFVCSPNYSSYLGSCPTGGNCSSYTSYEGSSCGAVTRYTLNSCNGVSSSYPLDSCPTGGNCSSAGGYYKSGNSCVYYTKKKLDSCNGVSSSYTLDSCPTGGNCSSAGGYYKSGNSCVYYTKKKLDSCNGVSSSYTLDSCPTGGNCSSAGGYYKSGNSCVYYTKKKLNSCNAASSSYTLTSCPSNCNCSSTTGYTKSGNSCNSYTRYKIDSAKSGYKVSGSSCVVACTPVTCASKGYDSSATTCHKTVTVDNCGTNITCYINGCDKLYGSDYSCIKSSQIPTTSNSDVRSTGCYNGYCYCMKPLGGSSGGGGSSTCSAPYSQYPCPSGWTESLNSSASASAPWYVYDCKKNGTVGCTVYKCKNSSCNFYQGSCYKKGNGTANIINTNYNNKC